MEYLKGGWKIIPKLHGDPKYAQYVQRMAEELKKRAPEFKKPIKPDGMSEEDFLFSLQQPSTKEILTLHKDPDYKGRDWTAPLPENYLANPNAKSHDDLVNKRFYEDEERDAFKNTQRNRNTLGQSTLGVSDDSKARAIDHFLSHPGIPEKLLSDEEIMSIQPIEKKPKSITPSIQYEWKPLTFWQAIKHFLKGGRIRRD